MSDQLPLAGHPLRKLGSRLATLLDEDQWAECERMLIQGWATMEQERKALAGLSKDALDGGWTYAGMNAYALKLESQLLAAQRDNKKWFAFAMSVGERFKCWASSFPDANDHILRAIEAHDAKVKREGAREALWKLMDSLAPGWPRADIRRMIAALDQPTGKETP